MLDHFLSPESEKSEAEETEMAEEGKIMDVHARRRCRVR